MFGFSKAITPEEAISPKENSRTFLQKVGFKRAKRGKAIQLDILVFPVFSVFPCTLSFNLLSHFGLTSFHVTGINFSVKEIRGLGPKLGFRMSSQTLSEVRVSSCF